VPSFGKEVKRAYLLIKPKSALKFEQLGRAGTFTIALPASAPDPIASVVVLETR